MKQLIFKLITVPIVSFFPTILSAAIIGSFWDIRNLEWLFPNKNAWQVYVVWIIILGVATIAHHFLKKKVEE